MHLINLLLITAKLTISRLQKKLASYVETSGVHVDEALAYHNNQSLRVVNSFCQDPVRGNCHGSAASQSVSEDKTTEN